MNSFLKRVDNDLHRAFDEGMKSGATMMVALFEDWIMMATSIDDLIAFVDDFKRRSNIDGGSEEKDSI